MLACCQGYPLGYQRGPGEPPHLQTSSLWCPQTLLDLNLLPLQEKAPALQRWVAAYWVKGAAYWLKATALQVIGGLCWWCGSQGETPRCCWHGSSAGWWMRCACVSDGTPGGLCAGWAASQVLQHLP